MVSQIRSLFRAPEFTIPAVVTLALGIGVNVALFGIVSSVLLVPLPYPDSHRLTVLWAQWLNEDVPRVSHTGGDFREYQRRATLFEGIAAIGSVRQNLTGGEEPLQVQVGWVSENFFRVLQVPPILGRDFAPNEPPTSVLVGYGLWQSYFGGDPDVVGATVELDGRPYDVLGVLPPDFALEMSADVGISMDIDLWKPPDPVANPTRWETSELVLSTLRIVGRLEPGVSLEQAQSEMDGIADYLRATYPDHERAGFHIDVQPLHREVVGHVRPALLALLGAVTCVLLIACANVANLLLVRSQRREREWAIRRALGATRARLVLHSLLESLLIAGSGGVLGVLLGWAGLRALIFLDPTKLPRPVVMDMSAVGYAVVLTLFTALIVGVMPSLRGPNRSHRVTEGLIVSEIALSLMLLLGAGLLLRSFVNLSDVRAGFDADGLLTFSISLPSTDYPPPTQTTAFLKRFEERIATLPGVDSVGTVWPLPLEGQIWAGHYRTTDTRNEDDSPPLADFRLSSPGYLGTVGARLMDGRYLREDDLDGVVVDKKLADMHWPERRAVGQELWVSVNGQEIQSPIVGVVENIRHADLKKDGRETIYMAARGFTWADWELAVIVRATPDPLSLVAPVREELRNLDSEIPMAKVRVMNDYVSDAVGPNRFAFVLASVFAGLALLLAAVGLYGVMAYGVGERMREMGIRMALGASRGSIYRLVLGKGLLLAFAGITLGLLAGRALGSFLGTLLFGVELSDAWTAGVMAAVLTGVSLFASFGPARRAVQVDPALTLKSE